MLVCKGIIKLVDYYHADSLSNNDKVLMLLASDDVGPQLQGVSFELFTEQQREQKCFQKEGRNPYLISIEEFENDEYCSAPKVIKRCSFFPPDKYRYPRFISVCRLDDGGHKILAGYRQKLHVQNMIATGTFQEWLVICWHIFFITQLKSCTDGRFFECQGS